MIGPASSSETASGSLSPRQHHERIATLASTLPRGISAISKNIFLERPCRCETRVQLLLTVQLVRPVETELAFLARAHNPLDTSSVTNLPQILYVRVHGNNLARTFMSSNAVGGISHLYTKSSPLIVYKRFVRGAEASPVDLDEDLT
jgi:hypothetical protein